MVLIILAVIWAAVLIPPWVHNRRERRPAQTIASFHRRLASIESIERTAPPLYAYADEMYVDAPNLELGESAGHIASTGTTNTTGTDDDDPAGPAGAGVPRVSRRALRRRRQVFFGLLVAVVGSMAAAVTSGSVMVWAVHGSTALLFVSYVALLVRHHQRVVEQVAKVRYLAPIRVARPAVVVLRSGAAR